MSMGHCPTLFSLRTVHDTKVTVVEQWQELFTPPPCSNQLQHPDISSYFNYHFLYVAGAQSKQCKVWLD